ncbi:MAG: SprT family zinc-dependent metalloprotease [Acidobacteriota bacterium]|nr:SprT family zinc-dependent metalloprotease [Acidobacteriota bacterium]
MSLIYITMDEIKVKVIRSRRQTVSLEINPGGSLIVRAPYDLETSAIDDMVRRHEAWIKKKQEEVRRKREIFQPKKFLPGEKFLWLGKEYPLQLVDRTVPTLVFTGECFELAASSGTSSRQVLESWFRRQASSYLTRRVAEIAQKASFKYQKVQISSAATRWGSCSSKGTISLVWRLMMAPPEIIDYLIVHELAHTKEKNHSRAFWQLVSEFVPDYREKRQWLRANGFLLNL